MAAPLRLAINGFGRIGRAALRIALRTPGVRVVAINDIAEPKVLAHLFTYDTVYRTNPSAVKAEAAAISVDGQRIGVTAIQDPSALPWKRLRVETVLECTGRFTTREKAASHLAAGARRVIISAPGKGEGAPTLVLGTAGTDNALRAKVRPAIVSNASCTTNCIAPVMQVLEEAFGVQQALMTTVHAYTADQTLVDGPHRDLRRARAAAQNMVLTTTGAAIATAEVVPALKSRFDGISLRVPTICVSLADVTALVQQNVTVADVNDAFDQASRQAAYRGILGVSKVPLVSSDFVGDPRSAIVDLEFTRVAGGNLVKVLAWYDNEWGYANRLVELAAAISH